MEPLNIFTGQKLRIKLRRCKVNTMKVLCGTVSAFADYPVVMPDYPSYSADSTLCGESHETIAVCGEPIVNPHSFFLGDCLK